MSFPYIVSVDYEFEYNTRLIVRLKWRTVTGYKTEVKNFAKAVPAYEKTSTKCIEQFADAVYLATVDISIGSPAECQLNYFYNVVQQYREKFSAEDIAATKGAALALLKLGLNHAIKNGYLRPTAKIILYAAGAQQGKDMQGLVDYYGSLGLSLVSEKDCVAKRFCMMEGKIISILNKPVKVSEPVLQALNHVV
jgi:hypothetical protein